MIEKLTCCLAHPMNALRTLKEKINEVVDAVNNLPEGGGGGGSSQGVGVCMTFFECDTPDQVTFSNFTMTGTFEDIDTAYQSGSILWGRLTMHEPESDVVFDCYLGGFMSVPEMGGNIYVYKPHGFADNFMIMVGPNGFLAGGLD